VTDNGKTKFAIGGAFIPDKNKTFFNIEYRELYVKFKEIIDEYETSLKKNFDSKKRKAAITNESSMMKALNDSLSIVQSFGYNIKTLEIDDEIKLKALPQAQKRTSSYKKAVYVDKNYIYKGPYDENDIKLLRNII
jgi:hypothetical protein